MAKHVFTDNDLIATVAVGKKYCFPAITVPLKNGHANIINSSEIHDYSNLNTAQHGRHGGVRPKSDLNQGLKKHVDNRSLSDLQEV